MMKKIEIFDPAMCCPTGLCGTNISTELIIILPKSWTTCTVQ